MRSCSRSRSQFIQRPAHQRLLGGETGRRLPEVEHDVLESPLDLARQYGLAIDHRGDPVELGGGARRGQGREEQRDRRGGWRPERTGGASAHVRAFPMIRQK